MLENDNLQVVWLEVVIEQALPYHRAGFGQSFQSGLAGNGYQKWMRFQACCSPELPNRTAHRWVLLGERSASQNQAPPESASQHLAAPLPGAAGIQAHTLPAPSAEKCSQMQMVSPIRGCWEDSNPTPSCCCWWSSKRLSHDRRLRQTSLPPGPASHAWSHQTPVADGSKLGICMTWTKRRIYAGYIAGALIGNHSTHYFNPALLMLMRR